MDAEIVQDDGCPWCQRREEAFLNPLGEDRTVKRIFKDQGLGDTGHGKGRHTGDIATMVSGNPCHCPLPTRCAGMGASHHGLGTGFVEKDNR